jgi:hypothetical protein
MTFMRITIATPLYPPDIKEPAPYVKEIASRLASNHVVTVLAYNHVPEDVPGVRIVCIEKSEPTLMRIVRFFVALYFLAKNTDVLYVQNGPSVELPILLYLSITRKRPHIVVRLGDTVPLKDSASHPLTAWITRSLLKRVDRVVSHEDTSGLTPHETVVLPRPLPKPEWLPLDARYATDPAQYELSWNEHVRTLLTYFHHE